MEGVGMGIYEKYAEVYDRSGQIAFTLLMIPYLDRVLERHGFAGQSVLDLACGTGTMALALAEKGWRVLGLDASAAMLAQATGPDPPSRGDGDRAIGGEVSCQEGVGQGPLAPGESSLA